MSLWGNSIFFSGHSLCIVLRQYCAWSAGGTLRRPVCERRHSYEAGCRTNEMYMWGLAGLDGVQTPTVGFRDSGA